MIPRSVLILAALLLGSIVAIAADATSKVVVAFDTAHEIGGESVFDRKKFITVHSSIKDNDWHGEDDKRNYLLNKLDVYVGRDSGEITWELKQLRQNPKQPGFVDFNQMEARARSRRAAYAADKKAHRFERNSDMIVAAQVKPFWPGTDGIKPADGSPPWKLLNPEAAGQYMGYWLNMYSGGNGGPRPRFLELMNEPLYELNRSHPEVTPDDVFQYHARAAKVIRRLNKDILLGGYTAAFPDFEDDNFQHWETLWKAFIDTMGDDIDFYSFHLYDFPGINRGKQRYRSGANLEATFDMIEHYSYLKFGHVKPFVISEYGAQLHDWYNQPWSPYRDWLCLKSFNSMLMQLAAKPDRMLKTIPFVPLKAEWGNNYNGSGQPYYWRLMRRSGEPDSYTGDWVFTDQIKFYELWANVSGQRRFARSSDPNLQVATYVDGKTASIVLNNLVPQQKEVSLSAMGLTGLKAEKLVAKHLYLDGDKPRLDSVNLPISQAKFTLQPDATLVLQLTMSDKVPASKTAKETKYYADGYFQPIDTGKSMSFHIDGVQPVARGMAVLRVGLGRDHGRSLRPLVRFNGRKLDVPSGFKGRSQADRKRFFGVLEIPIATSLLKPDNQVSIRFPDATGHLSSLSLVVTGY